jgi:arabinosyltransferase C
MWLAICVAVLSVLPYIYGGLHTPAGGRYIGFQYNLDDHMVYAAWMRQAMEGHFLFDNRFAIDPQPGLTIHIYFFLLGLVAKVTGIALASALARAFFSFCFVLLLHRLIKLITLDPLKVQMALAVTVFGAGFGFVVWQTFGVDFTNPNAPLSAPLLGHLPSDVWQPEGFVFPSLLTNSLFGVSLCLIVGILICVLKARASWKPVPVGLIAFAVLMNIHSYDVLLLALVLLGFLAMSLVRRQASFLWVARVAAMAAGVAAPALWFLHVLKNDPVFQARAATPTYTENFRPLLAGYLLFMLLCAAAAALRLRGSAHRNSQTGFALIAVLLVGMFFAASAGPAQGYFVALPIWAVLMVLAVGGLCLSATDHPAINLLLSWAVVGFIAPYFPALFERKLTMGLSVPCGILGGLGLAALLQRVDAQNRRAVGAVATVLLCGTSIRWFLREFELINLNESNTTVHPIFLSPDAASIVDYMNANSHGRTVVLAMPGLPLQDRPPYIPDLNPILSGLTGVYTYAGHWSETPDYAQVRRPAATKFFTRMDPAQQREFLNENGIDYVVQPVPSSFSALPINDASALGQSVAGGKQFRLIRVR